MRYPDLIEATLQGGFAPNGGIAEVDPDDGMDLSEDEGKGTSRPEQPKFHYKKLDKKHTEFHKEVWNSIKSMHKLFQNRMQEEKKPWNQWPPPIQTGWSEATKKNVIDYEGRVQGLRKWNLDNEFPMETGAPPVGLLSDHWKTPGDSIHRFWAYYRFPKHWIGDDWESTKGRYPSADEALAANNNLLPARSEKSLPAASGGAPQLPTADNAGSNEANMGNNKGIERDQQEGMPSSHAPAPGASKEGRGSRQDTDAGRQPSDSVPSGASALGGRSSHKDSRSKKQSSKGGTHEDSLAAGLEAMVLYDRQEPRYSDNGKVIVSFKSLGASTDSIEPGYTMDGERILAYTEYASYATTTAGQRIETQKRYSYVVERMPEGHLVIMDESSCGGSYVFSRLHEAPWVDQVINKADKMFEILGCTRYDFQKNGWGIDWVAARPEVDPEPVAKPHRIVKVWRRRQLNSDDKQAIVIVRGLLDILVGDKIADAFTARAIDSGSEHRFRTEWEAYRYLGSIKPQTKRSAQLKLLPPPPSWHPEYERKRPIRSDKARKGKGKGTGHASDPYAHLGQGYETDEDFVVREGGSSSGGESDGEGEWIKVKK